jgi:hypothetical protein
MKNILIFAQNNWWWLSIVATFVLSLVYEGLARIIKTSNNIALSKFLNKYFPKFVEYLDKLIENKIRKP